MAIENTSDKTSDCVFCQIVCEQIPSDVVVSNENFLAFKDIQPRAATHVLIIPRQHHASLDDWVEAGESSNNMMAFVRQVAHELGVEGKYRLITNNGADAGQVVPHLHWHLLSGRRLPGF